MKEVALDILILALWIPDVVIHFSRYTFGIWLVLVLTMVRVWVLKDEIKTLEEVKKELYNRLG